MRGLDRLIKRERNDKCRRLKRLRKARDSASKYTKKRLLLSKVFKYYKHYGADTRLFMASLAKDILDNQSRILGENKAPVPPNHNVHGGYECNGKILKPRQ